MFLRWLLALASAAFAVFSGPVVASDYPSKPIRLVLGYGAGGGADAVARLFASEFQQALGTSVIVENRPGAYEQIAGRVVATAEPDGYTLLLGTTGGLVIAPLLHELPFDTETDFTHVGLIAEADAVYSVRNGLEVDSMEALIEYARQHPNKLNFASAGTGSVSHLLIEYMKMLTNVELTHVPYKSSADVVTALVAGNVDFAVAVPAAAEPLVNGGRIRALAVTAPERLPKLPNVPSVEEGQIDELKGMSTYAFYSISGPKGMPADVVEKLSRAIHTVANSDSVKQKALDMNFRAVASSPEEYVQRIADEKAMWSNVMKQLQQ